MGLCIMENKQKLSYVQEKITASLIELLKKNDIDDLSVSDIVKHAGVGRASFYRNFDTKRDVLVKHLQCLILEWGNEFEELNDPTKFSESLLNHYYTHKDVYLLLYRQNLSSLIYEQIRWATHIDDANENLERYIKSTVSGLIFGVIDEWMRLGMPDSPSEFKVLLDHK